MKYRIEYAPQVESEIAEIIKYVKIDNCIAVADKVLDKIFAVIESIPFYAHLGASAKDRFGIKGEYKYFVVYPYPYIVFYKLEKDIALVSHVIDGRRDYIRLLNL
jgi:plasmid stabilization system protein ParE